MRGVVTYDERCVRVCESREVGMACGVGAACGAGSLPQGEGDTPLPVGERWVILRLRHLKGARLR